MAGAGAKQVMFNAVAATVREGDLLDLQSGSGSRAETWIATRRRAFISAQVRWSAC